MTFTYVGERDEKAGDMETYLGKYYIIKSVEYNQEEYLTFFQLDRISYLKYQWGLLMKFFS